MSTTTETSTGPETLRLFIAIDTSSELRRKLRDVQEELGMHDTGIRWVRPDCMHFTIVFLGDASSTQIPPLTNAMDMVSAEISPFSCNVTGLGTFGGLNSPRVIWAGIREAPALHAIHDSLCVELRKLDITIEDRDFMPHLTIGRVKDARRRPDLMRHIMTHEVTSFGPLRVDSLLLMKSELLPGGPQYSVLHRTALSP